MHVHLWSLNGSRWNGISIWCWESFLISMNLSWPFICTNLPTCCLELSCRNIWIILTRSSLVTSLLFESKVLSLFCSYLVSWLLLLPYILFGRVCSCTRFESLLLLVRLILDCGCHGVFLTFSNMSFSGIISWTWHLQFRWWFLLPNRASKAKLGRLSLNKEIIGGVLAWTWLLFTFFMVV